MNFDLQLFATSTIPVTLVPKVWAAKVWKEGTKESYFNKFTASDGSKPIHVNKDLTKQKGDKVTFGLQMNLTGAGVTGNNTLKGNEEALTLYDFGVTVDQIRNAVTMYDFDNQKSPYEMWPNIKTALVQWFSDWQDNTLITKWTTSPTATEVVYAGTNTAENTITAADKLTCTLISKAKRTAIMHSPKVKPIKIDGEEWYIMLVGTYAARDLKTDTAWQDAQKNAAARGKDNPIFTGALGSYDGVVLYEYERISNTASGASSANVVHNLLLGQQAACYGVARDMFPIEQDDDYGNVQGQGVAFWGGIAKSVFNSKDYGLIQVMTGGAVG
jgi:N4-gp56 family major capsid protein